MLFALIGIDLTVYYHTMHFAQFVDDIDKHPQGYGSAIKRLGQVGRVAGIFAVAQYFVVKTPISQTDLRLIDLVPEFFYTEWRIEFIRSITWL